MEALSAERRVKGINFTGTLKALEREHADQGWFDFLIAPRPSTRGGGGLLHRCLSTERTEHPSQGAVAPRDDPRTAQLREKMKVLKKDRTSLTYYLAELASAPSALRGEADARRLREGSEAHAILGERSHVSDQHRQVRARHERRGVRAVREGGARGRDADRAPRRSTEEWTQPHLTHRRPVQSSVQALPRHAVRAKDVHAGGPAPPRHARGREPETKSISEQIIGEMLHELEVRMKKNVGLDARMHHGQRNWNTRADLERYPKFQAWWKQYQRFNAFGIFSNAASARWGLDHF